MKKYLICNKLVQFTALPKGKFKLDMISCLSLFLELFKPMRLTEIVCYNHLCISNHRPVTQLVPADSKSVVSWILHQMWYSSS
jgi:hypothetical protein